MPKIFLSYRRDDSDVFSGRLFDRLVSQYGRDHVFMDIDSIPYGADFREHIVRAVSGADVVLAIIGPNWTSAQTENQRRIDNPTDYVRLEIETALSQEIPVIPVLVGTTVVPNQTVLPDSLKPLAYRNGCTIDPGRDFHPHVERLIDGLNQIIDSDFGRSSRFHGDRPRQSDSEALQKASSAPIVEVVSGPRQGQTYQLLKERVVIGRHPESDIYFDVGAISAFHAQFVQIENGYALEDLGARNGAYVNGRAVGYGERVALRNGDRIHTGAIILMYKSA